VPTLQCDGHGDGAQADGALLPPFIARVLTVRPILILRSEVLVIAAVVVLQVAQLHVLHAAFAELSSSATGLLVS